MTNLLPSMSHPIALAGIFHARYPVLDCDTRLAMKISIWLDIMLTGTGLTACNLFVSKLLLPVGRDIISSALLSFGTREPVGFLGFGVSI